MIIGLIVLGIDVTTPEKVNPVLLVRSASNIECQSLRKECIMRTLGLVLLVVGLLMTIYTGYYYVTKETVVDLGSIEINKENRHGTEWSPLVGIAIVIAGGAILIAGRKRSIV